LISVITKKQSSISVIGLRK